MHPTTMRDSDESRHLQNAHAFVYPSDWHVDRAEVDSVKALAAPHSRAATALNDPLHSPPLHQLVGPGDQICIALTPSNSHCPRHILMPAILEELEAAGVHERDVTLLRANGLTEHVTMSQKPEPLGANLERYHVIDHDMGEIIHLGRWHDIPLTLNRHTLEADLLLSIGVVAPHLFAGYSGGGETVALGCAGELTIEALYALRFLCDPRVRPGQITENPFQEIIQSITHRAGLRFVVDAVLGPQGEIVNVQAGDPFRVHRYLTCAASLYNASVPQTYDVVVAGIDPLYDTSLYQVVLAALYLGLAPNPIVRPDGIIILPARTPQAIGQTSDAHYFFSALGSGHSPDTAIAAMGDQHYRPGEARAFQLARLLQHNQVILVGSEFPEMVEACHLYAATNMEQAVDLTRWLLGDDLDVLIWPHALHAMPTPPSPEPSFSGKTPARVPAL